MIAHLAASIIALAPASAPPAPLAPSLTRAVRGVERPDAYDDAKKASDKAHLARLEELAEWCHKEKAFLQRDKVYEVVLELDPDHKAARRYLKWVKDRKSGEWVRKRPYRAPRTGKKEQVAAYLEKRAEVDGALVTDRLALIEAHGETLDAVKKDSELRALLQLAPDDARIRELLGYVRVEGAKGKVRWTTRVVLETEERRDGIEEALEEARDGVTEAEEIDADRRDRGYDVEWEGYVRTKRIRAVANTDEDEAAVVAEAVDAAWTFIPQIVGGKMRPPGGCTVYLIDGVGDREAFIDGIPRISEDEREYLYDMGGTWVPGGRCACWGVDPEVRLDQAVKQTSVYYFLNEFGITTKRGWLVEGAGLYINQIMLGTRYTRHVYRGNYVDQSEPRIDLDIEDPDADWIEIAADYMKEVRPTRLAATFGRTTTEMSPEDVVLSYAFVAYLREGHGTKMLEQVMRRVGKGKASSVVVLEELLGAKLPEIQRRFGEWLDEVANDAF